MSMRCLSSFAALALLWGAGCATAPETREPPAEAAPRPAEPTVPATRCLEEGRVEADPDGDPLEAPPDVEAPPGCAQPGTAGMYSTVLRPGTGTRHPGTFSVVRVHYTGWTTDGRMFDSSVARGAPSEFGLNNVIIGWRYGLKLMVEGEKRRLWIPEELAYKGQSGPQGMLVFDVELLEILD